jgi:hypothetical protein
VPQLEEVAVAVDLLWGTRESVKAAVDDDRESRGTARLMRSRRPACWGFGKGQLAYWVTWQQHLSSRHQTLIPDPET